MQKKKTTMDLLEERARRGVPPDHVFLPDELEKMFAGRESELEGLYAIAREKQADLKRMAEQRRTREAVEKETRRVLAEWREEERQRAVAEARRRLGVSGD